MLRTKRLPELTFPQLLLSIMTAYPILPPHITQPIFKLRSNLLPTISWVTPLLWHQKRVLEKCPACKGFKDYLIGSSNSYTKKKNKIYRNFNPCGELDRIIGLVWNNWEERKLKWTRWDKAQRPQKLKCILNWPIRWFFVCFERNFFSTPR